MGRSQGIRCVVYLDDGIIWLLYYPIALTRPKLGLPIWINLGWWSTLKRAIWVLLSVVNSWVLLSETAMLFAVPSQKIQKFLVFICNVINSLQTTPRILNAITGKLQSMHLSMGLLVRLLTRCIYSDIAKHMSWDSPFVPLSKRISELCFWRDNILDRNGYPIKPIFKSCEILFTNASWRILSNAFWASYLPWAFWLGNPINQFYISGINRRTKQLATYTSSKGSQLLYIQTIRTELEFSSSEALNHIYNK